MFHEAGVERKQLAMGDVIELKDSEHAVYLAAHGEKVVAEVGSLPPSTFWRVVSPVPIMPATFIR